MVAALFVGVGLVRALVVFLSGHGVSFAGLWPTLGWYVGGFAVGGGLAGLLWPVTRSRLGRYFLSILGAACVVGALFIESDGPPWVWTTGTLAGFAGLSLVFGLAAAIGIERAEA